MDRRVTLRMGLLPILALALALLSPASAAAHAELTSTSPADGEELADPPDEVVMTFGGELDPDGSGFVVTDADGVEVGTGAVDLEVAERNELRGAVDITGPGEYTVSWTSAAADGHPEEGTFTFTVVAPEESPTSDGTPDTAAAGTVPHPLALLGFALLALSALLGVRAAAVRS